MPGAFILGDWQVDPDLRIVARGGHQIRLEPKVMQVLELLADHRGQVVSKERLLQTVWAETFVGDEVLARAISEIRRVLEDDPKSPRYIQTIPKGGYRLVAPVTARRPTGGARVRWISAAAILLALGIAGALLAMRASRSPAAASISSSQPVAARLTRVTSLPGVEGFPALSPNGEQVVFTWSESRAPLATSDASQSLFLMTIGSSAQQRLTDTPTIDMYPAWSPDGQYIAFLRANDHSIHPRIFVIPAVGGPARVISDFEADGRIEWTPDGRFILAGSEGLGQKERGVMAIPVAGGTPRPIIHAGAPGRAFSPALSPDHSQLAYAECAQPGRWFEWSIDWHYGGSDCSVNLVRVNDGLEPISKPVRLAAMPLLGGLVWTREGDSVLFFGDASGVGTGYLWRLRIGGRQTLERMDEAGPMVGPPSTSFARDRVMFGRFEVDVDMYRFTRRGTTEPIASSASKEFYPAYSNDGRHIAFCSDRTGDLEIWVADADGTNVRRLTNGPNHRQQAPKWSPDDRQIAFESVGDDGHSHIWITPADAGPARQITSGPLNQGGVSWSRDGKQLYFAQDNATADDSSIWRVPASGGASEQITTGGSGGRVFESPDGRAILYQVALGDLGGKLVLQPLDGSHVRLAVQCARGETFTWTKRGIYYLPCDESWNPSLHLLDVDTGLDTVVGRLELLNMEWQEDLAVAPDGDSVLYARTPMNTRGDLWMLDRFR
jgi:Tol biopolymer transport system component/DNA-binding winged helix-turn-helix (wHTH) protein